jgi:hypothetical protein
MKKILSIFVLFVVLLAFSQFSTSKFGADRGGDPLNSTKIAADLGGEPLIQVSTTV